MTASESGSARREVSVAGHCMQAGDDALERAESYSDPEEAGYRAASAMSAVSMWAFALEADVNHLLHRLLEARPHAHATGDPTLGDAYALTLRERIELFYRWAAATPPDFGKRPFQVVGTLKSVRDSIVHGKPHVVEIEVSSPEDRMEKLPRSLKADWEPECTVERAKRHRDDVVQVHRALVEAAGGSLGNPLSFLAVITTSYTR